MATPPASLGPHGLSGEFHARYRLEQLLGQGGMGTVFRALDLRLDRWVAIKFLLELDRDSLARFAHEGRTLARVRHAHVTAIYEPAQDGDVPFIVTELVDGASLAVRLDEGPLAQSAAATASATRGRCARPTAIRTSR